MTILVLIFVAKVMIAPGGVIKLTDFGLAAQLTADREQRSTMVIGIVCAVFFFFNAFVRLELPIWLRLKL